MSGVSIVPPQVTTTGTQAQENLESQVDMIMDGVQVNQESQVLEVHGVRVESQEVAEEDHGVRVASPELALAHGRRQGRSHHRHGRQLQALTSGLLLPPFVIHQHQLLILPSLAQPPRLVNSVMTTMYGIGTHLAIHATMVPTKVAQLQEYLHLQVVKLVVDVLQLFLIMKQTLLWICVLVD